MIWKVVRVFSRAIEKLSLPTFKPKNRRGSTWLRLMW
jgi:hypothetical protein